MKTTKTLSNLIGYGDRPSEGDYKEVTSVSGWFQLGGFTDADEYYVVRGNVSHTTLNVLGNKVHLILCDGATLTLTGGILMYGDHKLYIHSQSYGGSMGKLVVQSGYNSDAAGIGSDYVYGDESTSYKRTPADLEIHGGDIYAKGGDRAAGIGGIGNGPAR